MPVDTGKTLLLDRIRKSSVQAREAGGITQHIGASFFPVKTLTKICGPLLKGLRKRVRIPGLLVIDTPGHEAFANLRKRGGTVADIAILVIDILKGFEAQTSECIDILKARKTPFLVAANKIDRLPGWKSKLGASFSASYQDQDPYVRQDLDERLYAIIGTFSRLDFRADRFEKISDFTRTVAIVPTSAKTGEGIPELLVVLIGLVQQHLRSRLRVTKGPAKGTVLEVKEEPGLGITINAIIYDGVLQKGDIIVVGAKEKPIVTNVRAVLLPKPLDEIRDPRDKFSSVDAVSAAAGIKIAAPNLEEALAGAPLYVVPSEADLEKYAKTVLEEVEKIRIATDLEGVVLKTDTLGSLEAVSECLRSNNIPIRLADVGDVSKRDITEAAVVKEHEPLYGAVLAFSVKMLQDAEEEAKNRKIPIFQHNIIYHLIDNYTKWMKSEQNARLQKQLKNLVRPGKIKILSGCVFRRARPAIIGIEVLAGVIKPKYSLSKEDGVDIGEIKQIQDKGQSVSEAKTGMQVAISLDKPIVGRHIFEEDTLYVRVPESHAKILLTKFQDQLSTDELNVLNEFVELMRRNSLFWAA
ncbi:MAG: translation initiation factor IF-2 [Candidatus Bathyarchaeota archaeon]|nr:translation initiation factor IF-2 [Candidatus Bathyarchaeota archaeon]MDH5733111.1 translation initiation factor IF-2 [Candidatus Bathyarchaeota archaeon]